jgi:hypothetical protein
MGYPYRDKKVVGVFVRFSCAASVEDDAYTTILVKNALEMAIQARMNYGCS